MSIETYSGLFLLKRYSSNTTMKCKQKVLRIPVLHAWRTQSLFMSQTFQTKLWTIHISQFSPLPLISDSLPRLLIIYVKCSDFSSTLVYVYPLSWLISPSNALPLASVTASSWFPYWPEHSFGFLFHCSSLKCPHTLIFNRLYFYSSFKFIKILRGKYRNILSPYIDWVSSIINILHHSATLVTINEQHGHIIIKCP